MEKKLGSRVCGSPKLVKQFVTGVPPWVQCPLSVLTVNRSQPDRLAVTVNCPTVNLHCRLYGQMTERISARSCCHYQHSITTVLPSPFRSMPIYTKKKQIADGLKQYAISMDTQLSERKKQGGWQCGTLAESFNSTTCRTPCSESTRLRLLSARNYPCLLFSF